MKHKGFLKTIRDHQAELRKNRTVIDRETALQFARDPAEAKLFETICDGAPQLVGPNFKPNWGVGVRERVGSGPCVDAALEFHAAKSARTGHSIIVPLTDLLVAAIREGVEVHVSERFLRDKDTDVMGRPIPDYSNTAVGVPPNDASLRPDLCKLWGKISHPTAVDLCAAMEAAKAADPNENIFISRVDIKLAYPRVLINAKHSALLSTLVTTRHPIYGVVVSVPIVNQWGAQGAGNSFEALGRNLLSRSLLRFNHVDQTESVDVC